MSGNRDDVFLNIDARSESARRANEAARKIISARVTLEDETDLKFLTQVMQEAINDRGDTDSDQFLIEIIWALSLYGVRGAQMVGALESSEGRGTMVEGASRLLEVVRQECEEKEAWF